MHLMYMLKHIETHSYTSGIMQFILNPNLGGYGWCSQKFKQFKKMLLIFSILIVKEKIYVTL